MRVENKNLLITDPIYLNEFLDGTNVEVTPIIRETTIYGDWSCMVYKGTDVEAMREKSKEWNKIYFDYFNKVSVLNNKNVLGEYDDEIQSLLTEFEEKKKEWIDKYCFGEFSADSGTVAVYTMEDIEKALVGSKLEKLFNEFYIWYSSEDNCYACLIPNYTGEVEYVVEGEGDEETAHIKGDNFYTFQSGL